MIIGAPLLWFLLGIGLLGAEFVIPGMIAAPIGVAALITACLALVAPLFVQVIVWISLSGILVRLSLQLVPKTSNEVAESREARSQAAIPPGEKGRVLYEGSVWPAKCSVEGIEIPANRELYVVERKGNTLIVVPTQLLNE